ncbi:hypothetical protein CRG98_049858 [Punica granatum]|uniref:Uncharacterized protein n=1 Tax=Punica granatum TaxID=22663 RepID=A0A2I0H1S5_PUNGR|nr:hypothetical protein CRG98_049858 [Punica granatum]
MRRKRWARDGRDTVGRRGKGGGHAEEKQHVKTDPGHVGRGSPLQSCHFPSAQLSSEVVSCFPIAASYVDIDLCPESSDSSACTQS